MTEEFKDKLENEPINFETLLAKSAEKFRSTPFSIVEVDGKRYTTATDTRAAVALTMRELNLLENESELKRLAPADVVFTEHQPIAVQFCDAVTKKLLEKFPEFSNTSFIRWGAYSNKGPITDK